MKRWIPWTLLAAVAASAAALWGGSAPGSAGLGILAATGTTFLAQRLFARTLSASWERFGLAFLTAFGAQAAIFLALLLAASRTPLEAVPLLVAYGAGAMLAMLGLGLSFPASPARGPA